ncbi:hypothetical protein [Prosthecobacter sp.]|uniref:hypothetical protein n=1 Tax=Prosthecobacter sp. TaxID=1965333 RepID=UPI001DC7932C|nr:hypothetical protein [Prosthecobacter sp.]MCB1278222.1 hypothetical protein [Prosthecobacter sp.]
MKRISLLLTLLVLTVARLHAQQEKDADPNIRPAGEGVLKFERMIEVPEIKRFRDGVLELFPGDTVHLEFEQKGEDLVRPKVVAKVEHPKRTITFKMTQDKSITMLSRKSEIQKTVAMDCEHRGIGSEEFFPTNLHPTEKGLMAGDSWPNSVWILRLSHIEVTDKPASDVYHEKVEKARAQRERNAKQESSKTKSDAEKGEK